MPSAKWSETQAFRPCWTSSEVPKWPSQRGARSRSAPCCGRWRCAPAGSSSRSAWSRPSPSASSSRASGCPPSGSSPPPSRYRGPRAARRASADEAVKRTLDPRWEELTELLDYRRLTESLIARTAAERRDASDIAAIRAAVERYTEAGSRADARIADHALHQAIARATHNERLADLSARIRREVGLGFDAEPYTPQMRQRALRQHPVLADAVIAGNPARAAKQATSHFSLTEGALAEVRARLTLRTGETDAHRATE